MSPRPGAAQGSYEAEIHVRAKPNARRSRLVAYGGSPRVLEVALAAKPVEGEANRTLLDFLSECLGLRRSALELTKGGHSRFKTIRVTGMTQAEVEALLTSRIGAAVTSAEELGATEPSRRPKEGGQGKQK